MANGLRVANVVVTWNVESLWSNLLVEFARQNIHLLLVQPDLVSQATFLVDLLLLEISFNFFKSLLLEYLFYFHSHCAELLELLKLQVIEFGVLRKILDQTKLVELLSSQIH